MVALHRCMDVYNINTNRQIARKNKTLSCASLLSVSTMLGCDIEKVILLQCRHAQVHMESILQRLCSLDFSQIHSKWRQQLSLEHFPSFRWNSSNNMAGNNGEIFIFLILYLTCSATKNLRDSFYAFYRIFHVNPSLCIVQTQTVWHTTYCFREIIIRCE